MLVCVCVCVSVCGAERQRKKDSVWERAGTAGGNDREEESAECVSKRGTENESDGEERGRDRGRERGR